MADQTSHDFDPLAEGWKPLTVRSGFSDLIGPLYARKTETGLRFGFKAEERHLNQNGIVHGGMLMTVADQVLGALVWHAAGRKPCATASLSSDFLSPVRLGDWVEAEAEMTRQGRSLVFVRGTLSVRGTPVLSASGIWKVLGA